MNFFEIISSLLAHLSNIDKTSSENARKTITFEYLLDINNKMETVTNDYLLMLQKPLLLRLINKKGNRSCMG